jgi:3-dehydroquinate synthase
LNDANSSTLTVGIRERAYPIHIGRRLIDNVGDLLELREGARAVVVTNAVVAAHYATPLKKSLRARGVHVDVVLLPDGEAHKNFATLDDLLTRLLDLRVERSTLVIALDGGVIGDIAGFAAAIYQRGIPFIQIPTTLLAQVDSSVGGKTGVNHPRGKNMIGAFWQPQAVVIDTDCLATLPERELRAGIAEVIKYGAIRDIEFFAWIEQNVRALMAKDAAALAHAIRRSCEIKAEIVAADERETGERALLNFGHTFGHAIEAAQGYGAWLHGEAVAAGMVCAARLSERVCGLDCQETRSLAQLIEAAGLPTIAPDLPGPRWLELMRRDKKVQGGAMRFVLIDRLGHALVRSDVSDADVLDAVKRAR